MERNGSELSLPKMSLTQNGEGLVLTGDGSYDYDMRALRAEADKLDPSTISTPFPGLECSAEIRVASTKEMELNRN